MLVSSASRTQRAVGSCANDRPRPGLDERGRPRLLTADGDVDTCVIGVFQRNRQSRTP